MVQTLLSLRGTLSFQVTHNSITRTEIIIAQLSCCIASKQAVEAAPAAAAASKGLVNKIRGTFF